MASPAYDLDHDAVLQRLARLERANRRLVRMGAIGPVVVAALLVMGQTLPQRVAKVIEAEEFVLREPNGTVRARLAVEPHNYSGLSVYDKTGRRVVDLGILPSGGPSLLLRDKSSVGIEVHNDIALVSLADKEGKARAGLAMGSDGTPSLHFFDRDEKARALIQLEADGSPSLKLLDGRGTDVAAGATAQPRHWVLWLQLVDQGGVRKLAAGAWPTRDECEAERHARAAKVSPTPPGSSPIPALACLPDSVNLGDRP